MIRQKWPAACCCLLLLLCLGLQPVLAQTEKKQSLKQALDQTARKYGVSFLYQAELVKDKMLPMVKGTDSMTMDIYLQHILSPFHLICKKIEGRQYAIITDPSQSGKSPQGTFPQEDPARTGIPDGTGADSTGVAANPPPVPGYNSITDARSAPGTRLVQGIIYDQKEVPVAGATIAVPGNGLKTVSHDDGQFSLAVPDSLSKILISFIGYEMQEVSLLTPQYYKVYLKRKPGYLQEVSVVSTGYQSLNKERATGSFGVISAEQLNTVPVPNVLHRLEGQIPGVQVQIGAADNSFLYTNSSPNLNGTNVVGVNDYSIRIRGTNTLTAEKTPLVVIDGFPTQIDMRSLNPDDIAQITFLRDAAAASIWGARAANGVIVIDTKKGKNSRSPDVSFSVGTTFNSKPNLNRLHLISSPDEINYEQELVNKGFITNPLTISGAPGTYQYPQYVSDAMDLTFQLQLGLIDSATYKSRIGILSNTNGYKDIQKYLLHAASNQQYNLSVSGGSETQQYYISGSYSKELSSTVGYSGERYTFAANQQFRIRKRISLSIDLKGAFFNSKNNGAGLSVLGSGSQTYLPYNRIVDANGNSVNYSYMYYHRYADSLQSIGLLPWKYNYLNELKYNNNTGKEGNYSAAFNLNIPLWKGLSVSGQYYIEKTYLTNQGYSSDSTYGTRTAINQAISFDPYSGAVMYNVPLGGILNQSQTQQTNYNARTQLTYNGTIRDIHQVNAVAGAEIRQTSISQDSYTLFGYNQETGIASTPLPVYTNWQGIDYTTTYDQGSQQEKTRRFLSYYTNVAYTLLNKYTLTGSARYDDYNNFGLDRKYRAKPFWSSGVSWNISKEKFMDKAKWINSLLLRTTYGVNGNIAQGIYPFTNISLNGNDYTTGLPSGYIVSPANPALRWESTYVLNVGLDFSLFAGRLSGSAEIYSKQNKDLLYQLPVDPTYGQNYVTVNAASTSNHGVDLGLNAVWVSGKKWRWNTGITFSYNTNKVTGNQFSPNASFFNYPVGALIKGYASDAVLVFRNAGLDATGLTQVYDEKGAKVSASGQLTSVSAFKYAGRMSAPYFGGLNNTIGYKNFSLFCLVTYNFGNVFMMPTTRSYGGGRFGGFSYDLASDKARRWRQPGDEAHTNVPGISGAYASTSLLRYETSDINVQPGDYIRLREVSLSYKGDKKTILHLPVKGFSISGVVRNPGLVWKKNKADIDPDFIPNLTSLRIPPMAAYSINLALNF